MARHDGVQAMPVVMRIERAGELDRTHHLLAQHGSQSLVFALEETVVKAHVVCSQYRTVEIIVEDRGDVLERGCSVDHVIRDAGQAGDEGGNADTRIDQRPPALRFHSILVADEGDLCDPVIRGGGPCRFQIEEDEIRDRGKHEVQRLSWGEDDNCLITA